MKQSLRSNSRIARAKRTRVGRFCCRLLGDCAGGVLMEYVLLGLLVVAAVAGIVIAFGDSIGGVFETMSNVVLGRTGKAQEVIDESRDRADTKIAEGKEHQGKMQQ